MRHALTLQRRPQSSGALLGAALILLTTVGSLAACGDDSTTCTTCGADAIVDADLGDSTATVCSANAQFVDGACECFEGYAGNTCSSCAPGYLSALDLCVPGCAADTCAGHGTCAMVDGRATCTCDAGWGEPFCEACARGFAEQGGVCVDLCADRGCSGRGVCDAWSGYATCLCDEGYIGQDCESCAPYYGLEGGECTLACQPNACNGHGYCEGITGVAVCSCDSGYIGDTCDACPVGFADTGDECRPVCEVSPCNNASCDPTSGEAVCSCYDTYEGTNCESCVAGYEDLGSGVCGANVVSLSAALNRTCALLDNGTIRCWGGNTFSSLGYPGVEAVGCDTLPIYQAGAVDNIESITQVAVSREHTCVLSTQGEVHCFGSGSSGKLGYGNTDTIGDDEPVASGGPVSVGGTVAYIATSTSNTCAILSGGELRCWGLGNDLYAVQNSPPVGDDELPSSAPFIDVGGAAVQVELGEKMGCVRRADGAVRCWGNNGFGALGAGTPGAWLNPATLTDVSLPGLAVNIAVGDWHACAALQSGDLYCWGINFNGELGYGHTDNLGKDQTPAEIGPVNVGGSVVRVEASGSQTCVVLTTGALRCWGASIGGNLGYPLIDEDIGDDEVPASVGDIALPASVVEVALGDRYVCALLATGAVRCWGDNGADCSLGTAGSIGGAVTDPSTAEEAVLFYGSGQ